MPGQLFHHLDGSNHISYDEKKIYEGRRFRKQYFRGCTRLIANSVDQVTMFLTNSGNELLTLYFAAKNTKLDEYVALVIAFACLNILVNKVILACTASLQTLLKEASRQHHYQKIHIYLKKTTIILFAWTNFSVLLLNLFTFSLRWLKISSEFSNTFQTYINIIFPAYYFCHIPFSLMRSLYLSHGNVTTPAFLNLSKLILTIVFHTLFHVKFGPKFLWIPLIKILTEATVTFFFYLYARENRFFIHAFTQNWNLQIFKNLGRFAQVLMIKGSFIYLDRIIYDVMTLIAAFQLRPVNTIVQSCLAAYTSCLLSVPFGIISTTSHNLRSAIREGSESKARTHMLRGSILCFTVGILNTIISVAFSSHLPKLFWNQHEGKFQEFQIIFEGFLEKYPLILWAEMLFNLMNILFRNLNQKKIIWKCLIGSSFLIGIPTSLAFGVKFPQTLQGIFAGRIISLLCTYIILVKKLVSLDWWAAVRRVYFSHHNEEILLDI